MGAEWRPVVGWSHYEVSTLGGLFNTRTGNSILGHRVKSGHITVTLSDRQRRRQAFLHVLMLEAFVGPCPPGMQSLHGNDIPDDNRIENLRWGTPKENHQDRIRNGKNYLINRTHCTHHPEQELVQAKRQRRCPICYRASKEKYRTRPDVHARTMEKQRQRRAEARR